MKKFISLLLVIVLCCCLCSCGTSKNPEDHLISDTKVFAKAYIEAKLPNMLEGIQSIDVLRHEKITDTKWAVGGIAKVDLSDGSSVYTFDIDFAVTATYDPVDGGQNGFIFSDPVFEFAD